LSEVIEDDELGVHLRWRFERGVPVTLGMLEGEQRTASAIDRPIQPGGKLIAAGISSLFRTCSDLETWLISPARPE
jgi:hypothetical protein